MNPRRRTRPSAAVLDTEAPLIDRPSFWDRVSGEDLDFDELPAAGDPAGWRMARRPVASAVCAWLGFAALLAQAHHRFPPLVLLAGAVVAANAALLPGWDTAPPPTSAPGTALRLLSWPGWLLGVALRTPTRAHPAATGSLLAVAATGAATWALVCVWLTGPWWIPAAVVCGFLATVLGDCLSRPGAPLGWPLTPRTIAAGWYALGGRIERWILTPLLVAAAVYLAFPAAGAMPADRYLTRIVHAVTESSFDPTSHPASRSTGRSSTRGGPPPTARNGGQR